MRHPVAIFFVALIGGILLLAGLSILLGLLVTHVLIDQRWAWAAPDNSFIRTLAAPPQRHAELALARSAPASAARRCCRSSSG